MRLLVPGTLRDQELKWIVEIEVYPGDYQGYCSAKLTDDRTIKSFSRIDSPDIIRRLRGV